MIEFFKFMKILHIIGARPQFIKAAMVSKAWNQSGEEAILHTGQHYDENMSRLFFDELGLPEPDINLGVGSGSHAEQTSRMLTGIDNYLETETPDWVIIYGDTNSTLAGALCAAKRLIKTAHVEAGLRSFNRAMPEEINRVVSDTLANLLFCPTVQAVENLKVEGITKGVFNTGDVMADGLFFFLKAAEEKLSFLVDLGLSRKHYGLVTLHRGGNVDNRENLAAILKGLGQIDFPLVFPVHPRTRKMLEQFSLAVPMNVRMIEPLGYLDMLMMEKNANCILTDSGGIQKEAYLLGTRCITLRNETEWIETVTAGWNCLTGADSSKIAARFYDFEPEGCRPDIYGDGHAADKIIEILKSS
jgi:UDP-N-acetylglucosamine 2-epimerase